MWRKRPSIVEPFSGLLIKFEASFGAKNSISFAISGAKAWVNLTDVIARPRDTRAAAQAPLKPQVPRNPDNLKDI